MQAPWFAALARIRRRQSRANLRAIASAILLPSLHSSARNHCTEACLIVRVWQAVWQAITPIPLCSSNIHTLVHLSDIVVQVARSQMKALLTMSLNRKTEHRACSCA